MALGFYYSSPFQHGGTPTPISAADRDKYAKQGVEAINQLLDSMDIKAIVDGLKWHRQWIGDEVLAKCGVILNFALTR